MIRGNLEVLVLIIDTTALLSQEKRMCLLDQRDP